MSSELPDNIAERKKITGSRTQLLVFRSAAAARITLRRTTDGQSDIN